MRQVGLVLLATFVLALTLVPASTFTAPNAEAHPGGTDGSGCHTCRTNCTERWGIPYGFYHRHSPVRACFASAPAPTTPPATATPAPAAPTPAPTEPTFRGSSAQPLQQSTDSEIVDTGGGGVALRYDCFDSARLGGAWPEGTDVEVTATGTDQCTNWSIARSSGTLSWVRDEYLAEPAAPVEPVATATPAAAARATTTVPTVTPIPTPASVQDEGESDGAGAVWTVLVLAAVAGGGWYWWRRRQRPS